jgi:hypothetical protein
MKRPSRFTAVIFAAGIVGFAGARSAGAAVISTSALAPSGAAISQPDSSAAAFNGSQDFTDNAGPPGQTFTTGAAGLNFTGVTVKGFANTPGSFGGNVNTGTWTLTVSRVDPGNVLTRVDQETANPAAVTNGADYVTVTLDTPVALTPNTMYAFDLFSSSGYFGLAKSSTDVYAGGVAMQHGATPRSAADGALITNPQTGDRTFFINPVPEPGSVGLLGVAGIALLARRRRA